MDLLLAFLCTLVIIFIVPIVIYGVFSSVGGIKEPTKKVSFLAGVLVQKLGTAIGFVGIFFQKGGLGRHHFRGNLLACVCDCNSQFARVIVSWLNRP